MQGFSRRTLRRPHSNLLSAGVAAPTMSLLAVPQLMAVPFSRSGNKETCHRTRGVPSFAKVAVNRMRAAKLPAASRPVGNQSASGPCPRGSSRPARGLAHSGARPHPASHVCGRVTREPPRRFRSSQRVRLPPRTHEGLHDWQPCRPGGQGLPVLIAPRSHTSDHPRMTCRVRRGTTLAHLKCFPD